jgi:crotonobetainyl-CoA:carnitine CoA-transferase CaiB-like acyl-CoA transferase
VRTPIIFSRTPLKYDHAAPRLGADDTAIRTRLAKGGNGFER